jgi:signal transduction histidine kinase
LGFALHWKSIVFFLIIGCVLSYIHVELKKNYSYPTLILIIFLFAIYTVLIVTEYSVIKDNDNKKVLLTANLANEHDRIAEFIINDNIQQRLTEDSTLSQILFSSYFNIDLLYNHLKTKYFGSYFDKYDLQVTVCNATDSLFVEPPDNETFHCYSFFDKRILERGSRINNTNFYYINNLNGQVCYLGWCKFGNNITNDTLSVFIELTSKLIREELGYPALLLDEKYSSKSSLTGYSYAKYNNGKLISQFGKYAYNLTPKVFEQSREDYGIFKIGGYNHMVHKPNKETLIVLSSPSITFIDSLISFSYTFLLYFLIITIAVGLINISLIQQTILPNFKNKIQFAMIGILFTSLILIGGGTLYYNLNQYYNKHIDILTEKLQAIYNELAEILGHEERINPDWSVYPYRSINELLIKYSIMFYVDINLYNPEGMLLGTSRPEIFEKGLIGTQINANAYKELIYQTKAEVINTEQIGKQKFISIYVPLKNDQNKLVAYLNIPYFAQQEEFTADISGIIVTVINIYVLLLLITIIIAIVISRSITMPLRLIQLKFSEIKLGQKYEKINYTRKDEIGGLVNEYNRMVTELEKNVELLAKSERESAWREMAKQIAHEINNPLTPMKLSVQHLQRAWTDKRENFEEFMERISKTLIDEIDNLSAIAFEFSNFAKMPNAINQKVNLIEKIENAVNLFSSNDVEFILNFNGLKNAYIYADKEQISRVFINLIKNAIQSVEKNQKPVLKINIEAENMFYKVEVIDNGKGIPVEIRDRLFRPNFTTKSGGMGLGLAIVKNILESIGGVINYETRENEGTKFVLKIPIFHN